ncbi:MAG: glycosyltransferase family 1 protein [Hyphomicrobiaceae bacterium]
MRVLIATDAWHPQVNGVVNTYERMREEAPKLGVELDFLTHEGFPTVPLPSYPEIRLALVWLRDVAARIEAVKPDHLHIATEGTIGLAMRAWCRKVGRPFTTSYHTRFPDYLSARFPVPRSYGYGLQRWFHNGGIGMMVASTSLAGELEDQGFRHIMPWTRGVDTALFHPRPVRDFGPRPVLLYVGRVAVEKNVEAFLAAPLEGRKVVVGGGPQFEELKARYPQAHFTGPLVGEPLGRAYASADVFVFPSRTDTFGNVIIEAMASGLPVAAYPVTGPRDLVAPGTGVLSEDLAEAAMAALDLGPDAPIRHAAGFTWQAATRMFRDNIEAARRATLVRAGGTAAKSNMIGMSP